MLGACHGGSVQCAPSKTQMDARRNKPVSTESLSEFWQQQWQHFIAEFMPLLQEPKVEYLWGDETIIYVYYIRHIVRAPDGQPLENFNY
jgi:hypothetical protein